MSALEAMHAARQAGVKIALDGDDLILEATAPPPEAVLALLSRDKRQVVALLRAADDTDCAEDWRSLFEHRAAIAEVDGGLTRGRSESRAFSCCVAEWLNRHPIRSTSDCCCWCGGAERDDNVLLPFGVEPTGHAWLHSSCWRPWFLWRKQEAVAALADLGVNPYRQ